MDRGAFSRVLLATLIAVVTAGCPSSDRLTLTVDVQTGLLPGTEFGFVELALVDGARRRDEGLNEPRTAGVVARAGMDEFRTGARIHTFDSVAAGVHTLRARLRRPVRAGDPEDGGAILIERWVLVTLQASRVVRVALTSSCLGVECPAPDGSPAFTECLNGRCVDPSCDPTDPSTASACCDATDPLADCSVPVACGSASDCEARLDCAPPECVEGACVETERPGACPDGTYCARTSGLCEPLESLPDGGTPDAGLLDASLVDAADNDAPEVTDANDSDARVGDDAAVDAFDPCFGVRCVAPDACWMGACMPAPWVLSGGEGRAYGIALDETSGDLFVVGSFDGALALPGCMPMSSVGGRDIFVARLSAGAPEPATGIGACVWARGFGSAGDDEGRGVTIDAEGNVYVTGAIGGDVDFGGGVLTLEGGTSTDLFVASFTASGAHRWSLARGWFGSDVGLGIAIDPGPVPPEVVVTGSVTGIFVFATPINTGGNSATLLARIDSTTGVPVFSSSATGTSGSAGRAVAVLPGARSGVRTDAVVVGSFRGRTDFATSGARRTSAGGDDMFVAAYGGASGLLRWVEAFGGTGDDVARAVAVDSSSIFVAGEFEAEVTFSGAPSVSTALEDGFVLSLDPSAGAVRWRRVFGTAGEDPTMTRNDSGRGLQVDRTGRVCVAGMASDLVFWAGGSAASLGACPLGCETGIAGWLEPDDSDGRLREFVSGTVESRDIVHAVASDGDRLFVAGEREGQVWFAAVR